MDIGSVAQNFKRKEVFLTTAQPQLLKKPMDLNFPASVKLRKLKNEFENIAHSTPH